MVIPCHEHLWVKSYLCVSASKKLEETVCQMEGNKCIIVSKIYVHFTRIYQGAAKLTQKSKYTCEHVRFGKKTTQDNHCKSMKKNLFRSVS
jgi:hypothetical protein